MHGSEQVDGRDRVEHVEEALIMMNMMMPMIMSTVIQKTIVMNMMIEMMNKVLIIKLMVVRPFVQSSISHSHPQSVVKRALGKWSRSIVHALFLWNVVKLWRGRWRRGFAV